MRYEDLGCSSYTPIKQESYARILRMHLRITKAVMQRWHIPTYHYFDLNAGPGRYWLPDDGTPIIGSPLVFLDAAREVGVPCTTVLIEKCAASCKHLLREVRSFENVEVRQGDHNVILDEYGSRHLQALGLIYSDPSNHEVPFEALSRFCQAYPKVEVLIHVAATAIKRTRAKDDPDLRSRLGQLNKAYWLVRAPDGAWQWTFLLGTNWNGFKDYQAINFYRMETPKGGEIIDKLNYTKTELARIYQPTLPDISGVPESSDVSANPYTGDAAEQWALRTVRAKVAHRGASPTLSAVGDFRRA
jgi:three-Cys-motif partner protein